MTQLIQDAPDVRSGRRQGSIRLDTRYASSRSRDGAESLLERDGELARIDAVLAEARAGRGTFLVIEGPAGIGKTALLAATRTAAAADGMRVLRARGTELERDFAFGVVRQLFEPPLAEASESVREDLLHAAAGVAAGLLGLPGAPIPDRDVASSSVDPSFAILHGLYWLSANLAAAGPLCLVIDDAQWADVPSLRYLAFLITRLEELEVALVLAIGPGASGTDVALLATLTTDPSAELIRLPPLTAAAVAELVESGLGEVPDPVFVDACVRATRGSPFLLRELVGALQEEGVGMSADGARDVERIGARTVGRSIRLRLRRLPEPAGQLARALAVLEQGDLHDAAKLADLDVAAAADAAELLAEEGILEPGRPLRFTHPIVRAGLYSELSSKERAGVHDHAARLLAERPGANEHVAKHLLASEPAAEEWVVERLVDAARVAARNGAPESAAIFLRRALAEPPSRDLSGLLLELGVAEASAGLDSWHEHLQRAVDTAPSAAAAAGAARVLARTLNHAQRFPEAVEVLDRAASALDPAHGELALQLEAAAVVAGMNDLVASPAVGFRRRALRQRVAADQGASPELLAAAAFISILSNEPAAVGAELASRATPIGTLTPGPHAQPWFASGTLFARATLSLLWSDRYAELRPLLDASIAQARASGDGGRLAIGLANRAWLALRLGDLFAAEGDTRTALAATELPAPPLYRVLNAGVLVKTLVDQGELDEAELVLAPLDGEAETGSLTATVLRVARGRLRVEQGRVAEGLEDFLAVGARLTPALIISPGYLPWRSEAALAHVALGDRDSALRLAEEELELARTFGAPRVLGVAARAAGVVTGGERGELLLREAVAAFEASGARLARAHALADLGAMLRRRNRRTEARELLRNALDIAHRAGGRLVAEQAETELRATGARPRRIVLSGLDSLTASERRIAELASQGLTNREIAQTLFITARTVEGHLTSIFRKLRVESRSDLHAALELGAPV